MLFPQKAALSTWACVVPLVTLIVLRSLALSDHVIIASWLGGLILSALFLIIARFRREDRNQWKLAVILWIGLLLAGFTL